MPETPQNIDYDQLLQKIETWSDQLGFQQLGVSDIDLSEHEQHLNDWLARGFHGEMDYMAKHGSKRSRPEQLVEDTCRVISVRMDYMPPDCELSDAVLADPTLGFISRYALGRDYHKVMRKRLQKLADLIKSSIGDFGYRVFVDSAPVLEKALAEKSGLGWIGKHTNLINQKAGSWFFLGEIYTNLPLPISSAAASRGSAAESGSISDSTGGSIGNHCGTCTACLDICPTKAIVAPYEVDARRCISYLTIELHGSIPLEFRTAMGNRIYGCDDCQLCCPWNRFSQATDEQDFFTRHPLDAPDLVTLFSWSEKAFLEKTEGSAIRRIGYQRWLRNIAVALGNAPGSADIISVLKQRRQEKALSVDPILVEHIDWALSQQVNRQKNL
jgi:epoxyqueuosine reductase